MKRAILLAILSLACVGIIISLAFAQTKGPGFSAPVVEGQWYDNSIALVVGINSYSHGWNQLSKAVSDGKKTAAALRKRGFTVHELYNKQATGPAIIRQLRKAARETSSKDRFIFFYSGHGYIEKSGFDNRETGYLVPVEGRSGDTTSYVPMEQLKMELTNNSRAKHTLVILDSCFSGLVLTRSNIPTATVSEYLNKRGIYGITAGMPNHKAVDGLFTDKLLEGLDGNADTDGDGYITFKELGAYAERNVKFKNSRQIPVYDVMAGAGQMVFRYASASAVAPVPPTPVEVESTYTPPDTSNYDAIAQAEQQRIEAVKATERKNREAKQKAIRKTYAKVKGYKQSAGYSTSAKKKIYKQFLSDFPDDNPYYDEVDGWYNEPEGMVKIPAGWFYMGCVPGDSKCFDREKPRKRVYLDSFYMDVYEVTQTEYQRVMGKNPSRFKNCSNCPVEKVSWNDAKSYCAKVGKELPTEAQWEYAARGGTSTARYGNLDSIAWCKNNSGSKTHPVGQKQPNAYGLYDTLGNVYEWCEDWYDKDYYNRMSERNPTNRTKASYRVIRGGGWYYNPRFVRTSFRFWFDPSYRTTDGGFRCSRD